MKPLQESITQYSSELILLLLASVLILIVVTFGLAKRLRKLNANWKQIFEGAQGENIERMLLTHLRDRMDISERLDRLDLAVDALMEDMKSAKRFVGLVRYDAFEDVGGAQSFALAIYDEQGDGVIVTSVVGRSDCRVYSKPLFRGRSERNLSQEEQRAIKEARDLGPKTLLSP